jgi:trehalose-6-phosphate synthase
MYKAGGEKKFDNKLWEAFKEANIKFAEVVSSIYQVCYSLSKHYTTTCTA